MIFFPQKSRLYEFIVRPYRVLCDGLLDLKRVPEDMSKVDGD